MNFLRQNLYYNIYKPIHIHESCHSVLGFQCSVCILFIKKSNLVKFINPYIKWGKFVYICPSILSIFLSRNNILINCFCGHFLFTYTFFILELIHLSLRPWPSKELLMLDNYQGQGLGSMYKSIGLDRMPSCVNILSVQQIWTLDPSWFQLSNTFSFRHFYCIFHHVPFKRYIYIILYMPMVKT